MERLEARVSQLKFEPFLLLVTALRRWLLRSVRVSRVSYLCSYILQGLFASDNVFSLRSSCNLTVFLCFFVSSLLSLLSSFVVVLRFVLKMS